jgi:hypothetical protein
VIAHGAAITIGDAGEWRVAMCRFHTARAAAVYLTNTLFDPRGISMTHAWLVAILDRFPAKGGAVLRRMG